MSYPRAGRTPWHENTPVCSRGVCDPAPAGSALMRFNYLDNVRFDLTPTPWPPSPLRGGEGKGVGGWGEVHLDRHLR